MSIEYAGGTIVSATFTQVAGTRAELADWIKARLVDAGWTSTGSPSDYQVSSLTTSQGLSARVRVYDPGSGNCARLKFSNLGGGKTQAGDLFVLPAASKAWQMIANRYQFFVFVTGASACREFACGGAPWTSSFSGVTEALWGGGNAQNDTDSIALPNAGRSNFRTCGAFGAVGNSVTGSANWVTLGNGTLVEANNNAATQTWAGAPSLVVPTTAIPGGSPAAAQQLFRWYGGGYLSFDPLIAWGNSLGAEPRVMGQIWDAVWLAGSWANDVVVTIDGRNFQQVTNNNPGNVIAGCITGGLFVAIT